MASRAAPHSSDATDLKSDPAGWQAHLRLAFERAGEGDENGEGKRTVLAERAHEGPLRVQRPFHPEGEGICHVYLLHPPGGIVGGDQLNISIDVRAAAHALITTPAATKLYRSAGARAEQRQLLRVAASARLEWLPQETIAFEGSRTLLQTRVELELGATFLGWEMICLGRPASDERFTRGELIQRVELYRQDKPLLVERGAYVGGGELLDAAWGLGGQPVVGTLCCVSDKLNEAALEQAREALAQSGCTGAYAVTLMGDLLVGRYIGASTEQGRNCFAALWAALRPIVFGEPARTPRIWRT